MSVGRERRLGQILPVGVVHRVLSSSAPMPPAAAIAATPSAATAITAMNHSMAAWFHADQALHPVSSR